MSRLLSVDKERFDRSIAILIAIVTTLATVIAYMQGDASARDDAAGRDTRRYSMEALGRQVSGDARVNFDDGTAYEKWTELDLQASSAESRGDTAAAARYQALRDQTVVLSPLLAAPYFDPETGVADVARYEADTYLVEVTALTERFVAASAVKDAWDFKANTYIVHLTFLAVVLFLYGLSSTIAGPGTRWLFAGVGSVIAIVAVVWAGSIYTRPVYDLRQSGGAIESYSSGVGLAYQGRWDEAITAFDQAAQAAPTYANAYAQRAGAYAAKGDLEAAVRDYERARAEGDNSSSTAGDLAWAYYLLGRFDEATAMNRVALKANPDELWLRFDLGLSLLASGQIDAAKAEYAQGMQTAATQVAAAKAAGEEPPSYLWWGLDDGALSLDDLLYTLDSGEGMPARDSIANQEAVRATAEGLVTDLKSQAVALEFTGQPPMGSLTAQISEFTFAQPLYDDEGEVSELVESDEFEFGVDEVSVLFDYEAMADGDEVVFKVYVDGEEDPSWRMIAGWDLGIAGSAEKPISLAYSDNFVLSPGEYTVEMYVNGHLAQRGIFYVADEAAA
ncbi:MAG: tetratricopeptide repeat protein [Anaerolineae bacterium]